MNTELSSPQKFIAELGLEPHQLARLVQLLSERPTRLSELSERGWQTRLGRQVLSRFVYYRSPAGYIDWRAFVGTGLLLDTAASYGLANPATLLAPFVQGAQPAAVRFVRRKMLDDLLEAGRYPIEPQLQAPLPRLLLPLPTGLGQMPAGDTTDEPVVVGIELRDGEHGLAIRITAWGRDGGSWATDWQAEPAGDLLSTLAWGAIGLLASEPEIVDVAPPSPTGHSLRRGDRPEPSWLTPPVVHRYLSDRELAEIAAGRRPHWRRGHRHTYRVGPGRKQERHHWIPPIWVQGTGEGND